MAPGPPSAINDLHCRTAGFELEFACEAKECTVSTVDKFGQAQSCVDGKNTVPIGDKCEAKCGNSGFTAWPKFLRCRESGAHLDFECHAPPCRLNLTHLEADWDATCVGDDTFSAGGGYTDSHYETGTCILGSSGVGS